MGEKIDLNGKQEETYGKKPEHVNYSKTTRNGMINRHQDSVFIYLFIIIIIIIIFSFSLWLLGISINCLACQG